MNLIICTTPFQLFLANYIISLLEVDTEVLLLNSIENDKFSYYYSILDNNKYVVRRTNILLDDNKLINYSKVIRNFYHKKYNDVIFASIDNFYIHAILSTLDRFELIKTFDDGLANIFPDSLFYNRKKRDSMARKIFSFIFNKWNMDKVKQHSNIHFTIYKNIKNIIDNTRFITPFNFTEPVRDIRDDIINIFIGQPLEEHYKVLDLYHNLSKLKHIYYYPHPREKIVELANIEEKMIINSSLLIEDYVKELLSKGHKVSIYTISSSAGLNLYNTSNVDVNFIKIDASEINSIYSLFDKNGIGTIDLTSIK